MRVVLAAALLLTFMSTPRAGTFEDAGAALDLHLEQLDQAIQELDERVHGLETAEPADPPPPPPNEPVLPVEPGQDPIVQHRIPVRIEVEDFDLGGEGVAYHDTTPENFGGMARSTGVDIKATGDIDGLYQVGWIADGEWLEYTIGSTAGVYDFQARVTKGVDRAAAFDVRLGGELLGQVVVPFTGAWDANYATVTLPCLQLEAGNKILRLEMIGGPMDINWVAFEAVDTPRNDPPCDIVLDDGP